MVPTSQQVAHSRFPPQKRNQFQTVVSPLALWSFTASIGLLRCCPTFDVEKNVYAAKCCFAMFSHLNATYYPNNIHVSVKKPFSAGASQLMWRGAANIQSFIQAQCEVVNKLIN